MTIFADLLHDAIEGHAMAGPAQAELAGLVRVARRARSLHAVGPTGDATVRMRADFARMIDEPRRPRVVAWLLAWTPLSPRPRPLVARLAAGAVLLAGAASSATTVAGDGPLDAVAGIAHFAANAVANLLPRDDNSGTLDPVVATPTPIATPTQVSVAGDRSPLTPEATPSPTGSPAPPAAQAAAAPPPTASTATPVPSVPTVVPGTPEPPETPGPTASPEPTPVDLPGVLPTGTATPVPSATAPTQTPGPSPTASPKASPSATPGPDDDDHEDEGKATTTPAPTQTPEVQRR